MQNPPFFFFFFLKQIQRHGDIAALYNLAQISQFSSKILQNEKDEFGTIPLTVQHSQQLSSSLLSQLKDPSNKSEVVLGAINVSLLLKP